MFEYWARNGHGLLTPTSINPEAKVYHDLVIIYLQPPRLTLKLRNVVDNIFNRTCLYCDRILQHVEFKTERESIFTNISTSNNFSNLFTRIRLRLSMHG